ncbi:MAG TPA: hypothetical protein VGC57_07810 [Cellulomonas sp.]
MPPDRTRGTSLDRLRDGLVAAPAEILREIGRELRTAASKAVATQELERSEAVHAAVSMIRFV